MEPSNGATRCLRKQCMASDKPLLINPEQDHVIICAGRKTRYTQFFGTGHSSFHSGSWQLNVQISMSDQQWGAIKSRLLLLLLLRLLLQFCQLRRQQSR